MTYEVEKNMKEWEDKLDSGAKERLTKRWSARARR